MAATPYPSCERCGEPVKRRKNTFCSRLCKHESQRKERPLCACGCGERIKFNNAKHIGGHENRSSRFGPQPYISKAGEGKRWIVAGRDGKPVYWTRIVMQNVIGRSLTAEEVVHHINGDRTDDRPENLRLFADKAEHMREHWKTWKDDPIFRMNRMIGRARI